MIKAILLLTCVAAFGCSTTRAPISRFQTARVTASTPEAISLDVEFKLRNDNDEPLKLITYTYTVSIDGDAVYHGLAEAEQTIPSGSTVTSTIPAVIPRTYLQGRELIVWHLSGSLDYVAHGALAQTLVDAQLWQPSTPIAASDSMDVPPIEWILGDL